MKKLLILMSLILGIAVISSAQTIVGSVHDFQAESWVTEGEICIPCHTPHNSQIISDAPLWNHEITTTSFTLYSSTTLDATLAQPTGVSLLCLSCHDGQVALDNYGGTTTGTEFMTGDASFGTTLANDHPISFTYNTALSTTDGELEDPSTATTIIGGTIDNDMLFSGKMECASCHDVHNTAAVSTSLLIIDNAGSALCLTCHAK